MTTAEHAAALSPRPTLRVGRAFMSPFFDLMLIGGGLSLATFVGLLATGNVGRGAIRPEAMLTILLLCNSTHFAASTVRLYTKPGTFQNLPMMTMAFPLLAVAALTIGLTFPDLVGKNLYKLYLTWSPYHYAAQTYGLAAMYAARSGCPLSPSARSLLWWTSMLPFAYAFMLGTNAGIGWFLTPAFFADHPALLAFRGEFVAVLRWVVFATPVLLFVRVYRQSGVALPLISIALLLTNGMWWAAFDYVGAVVWASIFHGIQYLAIVIVFHLRDHPPEGGGPAAWLVPALKFYGLSLALAYLLFEVWPYTYSLAGFSFSESALLCVAVINIHHFIVDRGIWRVRKDAANRNTVVQ